MKSPNIFILAAGFGERLGPITARIPKPLLPVLGRPILDMIFEKMSSLAFNQIGINMHYKWDMIKSWIISSGYSEKVRLFYEDKLLGTGGALKNAESFLRDSIFLVHNADILSDIDLKVLIEHHKLCGNFVTLAVHRHEAFNNVWIDNKGILKSVGAGFSENRKGLRSVAFTGIAVYSPSFLDFLPEGGSSVVDAWLKASKAGLRVGTMNFEGCQWSDIGSPAAYSSAIFQMLKKEGENIYVHPSVECNDVSLKSFAVIEEGSVIGRNSLLQNCIVLPGSRVEKGSNINSAIIGIDFLIDITESFSIPSSLTSNLISEFLDHDLSKLQIALIGTGGSDRKYYRIHSGEKSAVIMECAPSDPDFKRQIIYTQFFRKYSVPVPELLGKDAGENGSPFTKQRPMYALFEDLGDMSLYSWLKCNKKKEKTESIYRRVLEIIVGLHTTVSAHVDECPLLQSKLFDRDHFEWETTYFAERFVEGLLGAEIQERRVLNEEFSRLARLADSFRKTILHRDFQSQNVMVMEGDTPRIIDFQGARIGPPAYDLVSILWDPYVELDSEMRKRLVDYYIEKTSESDNKFDGAEFRMTILPCRLQRHMQALGAYGFLSKVKGKHYFLKYIPKTLQYLNEETELVKNEYPVLYELTRTLKY